MTTATTSVSVEDPVNAQILAVSEDRITGFSDDPFAQVSQLSGVALPVVLERVRAMMEAGTIRRVRQTLMANKLAPGALVAWRLPQTASSAELDAAFRFMFDQDPFSGHVVIRTTDNASAGSSYRLWTTVKVPVGYSIEKHCRFLQERIGAERFRVMPAKCLFKLGVGHIRRRTIEVGSRSEDPAGMIETAVLKLTEREWRVLMAMKRELSVEEIREDPWRGRAEEAGVEINEFLDVCRSLNERGIIGRFSTFLEHVKPLSDGKRVTRFNGLFHWAVPKGREVEAGREVGRHHVLTHAYWREGGPEFHNVNIMGVAHGLEKELLLKHKDAIDEHLAEAGIPVLYTNVFWGGRSEIKPSEVSPIEYRRWCGQMQLDPGAMADEHANRSDIRQEQ